MQVVSKNRIIAGLILLIGLIALFSMHFDESKTETEADMSIKKTFQEIYKHRYWSQAGDGSGPGSSLGYTLVTRNILYEVIKKYRIKKFLDSPCGSFHWMRHLMTNISSEIKDFEYHGIDVVEPVIMGLQSEFSDW
jgi:hypothetical protein